MNWFMLVSSIVGAVVGFTIGYHKGGKERRARITAEAEKNKTDTKGGSEK